MPFRDVCFSGLILLLLKYGVPFYNYPGESKQDRISLSINRTDISINRSQQVESAIPSSRIASLSSEEFVDIVVDDHTLKMEPKVFHTEILNDKTALKKVQESFKEILLICMLNKSVFQLNYLQVRQDK